MKYEKDVMKTAQVAEILGCTGTCVIRTYSDALVELGDMAASNDMSRRSNLYSITKIAEIVSKHSGHPVTVDMLGELISQPEAIAMLKRAGRERGPNAFHYWQLVGIGPTLYKRATRSAYLRSEIAQWAKHLHKHRSGKGEQVRLPREHA